MKVDVYESGAVTVVKPHGDLRVKTVVPLRGAFEALEKTGARTVAIDLSLVSFIDSSGIGLLANFAKRLGGRDGELFLYNYNEEIKDLLDITGLDQVAGMYESAEQMSAAVMGHNDEKI